MIDVSRAWWHVRSIGWIVDGASRRVRLIGSGKYLESTLWPGHVDTSHSTSQRLTALAAVAKLKPRESTILSPKGPLKGMRPFRAPALIAPPPPSPLPRWMPCRSWKPIRMEQLLMAVQVSAINRWYCFISNRSGLVKVLVKNIKRKSQMMLNWWKILRKMQFTILTGVLSKVILFPELVKIKNFLWIFSTIYWEMSSLMWFTVIL